MSRWAMLTALLMAACRVERAPLGPAPGRDVQWDWSFVLEQTVTAGGLMDYDRLESKRSTLDDYVSSLAEVRTPTNENERTALWLNAYTALCLYGVLLHDRPASVSDIPTRGLWLGSSFFSQDSYALSKEQVSLDQLFHDYLRMRSQDPRLLAATSCAQRSGPPLRPGIYMAHELDAELDAQMRWWVNTPHAAVAIKGDHAQFNAILLEYADYIARWSPGLDLCTFTAQYADEPLASELTALSSRGCPNESLLFDASLNHQTRPDRVQHAL